MKKKLLPVAVMLAATVAAVSCGKKDEGPSQNTNEGGMRGDTLWGKITANYTLQEGKTYYIDGGTFIKGNATLTVNQGVVVKALPANKTTKGGSSFLVITRGAKIMATGTAAKPIIFTSGAAVGARKAGDWGGLMLLGKANVNSVFKGAKGRQMEGFSDEDGNAYGDDIVGGGDDDNDNSGTLKYVRIEFAGIALSNKANSELNSLTMIGVGRGTTIDYVQSSFGGDDSFEWFGGTVNAKHLIAFRGLDDDFDTDNGYNGNVQFALSIRDKASSDFAANGDSNGFESDNDESGSDNSPFTSPVFSNVTFVGPAAINNGADIPADAVFNRSAHIRRNSRLSLFNSALTGFVTGLYIDGDKSGTAAASNTLEIKNTFIGAIGGKRGGNAGKKLNTNAAATVLASINSWFMTPAFGNDTTYNSISDFKFTNMNGELKTIDARPAAGSPLLGKASFTSSDKIKNSFFSVVTYVGAFADANDTWATGWTNFDPINTTY